MNQRRAGRRAGTTARRPLHDEGAAGLAELADEPRHGRDQLLGRLDGQGQVARARPLRHRLQPGLVIKNTPKNTNPKTHLKKNTKNVFFFVFFLF
jgi:hypothetical protein